MTVLITHTQWYKKQRQLLQLWLQLWNKNVNKVKEQLSTH